MIPNRVLHIQTDFLKSRKRLRVIDDWETDSENTIAEVITTDSKPLVSAIAQAIADTYLVGRVVENGTYETIREKGRFFYE